MKRQSTKKVTHFRNSNFFWKRKDCKSRKNFWQKKFYVHEIAPIRLSKFFFLKKAKKICKPNNRDLNRDWNIWLFIISLNPFKYGKLWHVTLIYTIKYACDFNIHNQMNWGRTRNCTTKLKCWYIHFKISLMML